MSCLELNILFSTPPIKGTGIPGLSREWGYRTGESSSCTPPVKGMGVQNREKHLLYPAHQGNGGTEQGELSSCTPPVKGMGVQNREKHLLYPARQGNGGTEQGKASPIPCPPRKWGYRTGEILSYTPPVKGTGVQNREKHLLYPARQGNGGTEQGNRPPVPRLPSRCGVRYRKNAINLQWSKYSRAS